MTKYDFFFPPLPLRYAQLSLILASSYFRSLSFRIVFKMIFRGGGGIMVYVFYFFTGDVLVNASTCSGGKLAVARNYPTLKTPTRMIPHQDNSPPGQISVGQLPICPCHWDGHHSWSCYVGSCLGGNFPRGELSWWGMS